MRRTILCPGTYVQAPMSVRCRAVVCHKRVFAQRWGGFSAVARPVCPQQEHLFVPKTPKRMLIREPRSVKPPRVCLLPPPFAPWLIFSTCLQIKGSNPTRNHNDYMSLCIKSVLILLDLCFPSFIVSDCCLKVSTFEGDLIQKIGFFCVHIIDDER